MKTYLDDFKNSFTILRKSPKDIREEEEVKERKGRPKWGDSKLFVLYFASSIFEILKL